MLRRVWDYIWGMEWVIYLFGVPRIDVWSEVPDEKPEQEVTNVVQLFRKKTRTQRARAGISRRLERFRRSTSRKKSRFHRR